MNPFAPPSAPRRRPEESADSIAFSFGGLLLRVLGTGCLGAAIGGIIGWLVGHVVGFYTPTVGLVLGLSQGFGAGIALGTVLVVCMTWHANRS